MDVATLTLKTVQPLPILPSWAVLLQILGFFGWLDQVTELLNCLSTSSRSYAESPSHKAVLTSEVKLGLPLTLTS